MTIVPFPKAKRPKLSDLIADFEYCDCAMDGLAATAAMLSRVPAAWPSARQAQLTGCVRRLDSIGRRLRATVATLHQTRGRGWSAQKPVFEKLVSDTEALACRLYRLDDQIGRPPGLAIGWMGGQTMAMADALAAAVRKADGARRTNRGGPT